jgi:hypothetical protein
MKDKITCPKCEGKPFTTKRVDRQEVPQVCSLCHGEGKVDPAELFEVECEYCMQGKVPCTVCRDGNHRWAVCDGEGWLPCNKCKSGWRPMTAKEVEEMEHSFEATGKSLSNAVILDIILDDGKSGAKITYNGKPVRIRRDNEGKR